MLLVTSTIDASMVRKFLSLTIELRCRHEIAEILPIEISKSEIPKSYRLVISEILPCIPAISGRYLNKLVVSHTAASPQKNRGFSFSSILEAYCNICTYPLIPQLHQLYRLLSLPKLSPLLSETKRIHLQVRSTFMHTCKYQGQIFLRVCGVVSPLTDAPNLCKVAQQVLPQVDVHQQYVITT